MKKIALLSVLVFLTACSMGGKDVKNPAKKFDTTPKVVSKHLATTSNVGEICGGKDNLKCRQGLSCIFDYDTEDGHGVCAEKITNEQECENIYDPVCGLNNGRQKYNYFNECQAQRHGAEVLYKGKCKVDKKVAGNCKAQARGFSNCATTTVGYEFDGKNCVKKVVASCDDAAEIPFTSLESCEKACQ